MTVEAYLAELARHLPRVGRGRVLAEVEDHLREAAREVGEEEAVARFGPPGAVARAFAPLRAVVWSRVAAIAAVLAVLSFPAAFPVYEHFLPPAPWASAGDIPGYLAWKRDAALVLALATGAAAVGALFRLPGTRLALATAPVALGLVWAVLTVEWADAVPGTPARLVVLAFAQLAVCLVPALCAARALTLARAASAAG